MNTQGKSVAGARLLGAGLLTAAAGVLFSVVVFGEHYFADYELGWIAWLTFAVAFVLLVASREAYKDAAAKTAKPGTQMVETSARFAANQLVARRAAEGWHVVSQSQKGHQITFTFEKRSGFQI